MKRAKGEGNLPVLNSRERFFDPSTQLQDNKSSRTPDGPFVGRAGVELMRDPIRYRVFTIGTIEHHGYYM